MVADPFFFDNYGPFSLQELIKLSGTNLEKGADTGMLISGVAPLDAAQSGQLAVLNNRKYLPALATSKASVCIMEAKYTKMAPESIIVLTSTNPYKAYALIASAFYPKPVQEPFISTRATIHKTASIGQDCAIAPNVVIGANVVIGNNCSIGAGTVIMGGVVIGDNCDIGPSVTISHAILGDNVMLHPGVRIGQDGFGFASDRHGHYKVPQLGRVRIGNNVEIGANSCIDRGSGHDTVIGDYCMIDNLVQIGHNVILGKGCVIVSQVGIAGSTKLGDFVVAGGQVGIAGHLTIGHGVQLAAQSGIMKDIPDGQVQGGSPAVPIRQWHKQTAAITKLTKKGEASE